MVSIRFNYTLSADKEVGFVMQIAIDVDGVLANHVPHVLKRLQRKWGVIFQKSKVRLWNQPIPNTNTTIDMEIESALNDPNYVLGMPIIPHAREGTKAILGFGHTIIIATSRPPESDPYTIEWLIKKNIPFHHFINTRVCGKLILPADILIDDRLETACEFARLKGFAILFLQPWNKKVEHRIDLVKSRFFCAEGWSKVVEIINLLSTKRSVEVALVDR